MKKFTIFLISVFFALEGFSQGLSLINPTTEAYGNNIDGVYIILHLKNESSEQDKNVIAKRKEISIPNGQQSYFCFATGCYAPSVNISPDLVYMTPGQEDSTFKGYIDPKGHMGSSIIQYCFVDNLTGTDSVCVTLNYTIGAVGIVNNSNKRFLRSFPNPATDRVTVLYNTESAFGSAELIITDLNGRTIEKRQIIATEGAIEIGTENMSNGLYIANVITDGVVVSREKIIISR